MLKKTLRSCSIAALLLAAAPALAAPRGGATMEGVGSVFLLLDHGYDAGAGYGVGARYQKLLVPEGVLRAQGIRDEIGLEFGFDFIHYSWHYAGYGGWSYTEFAPLVGGTWNVWLNDKVAIYPKIDLGYRIGTWDVPNDYPYGHPHGYGGFTVEGAVGAVIRVDRLLVRAEAGTAAFRLGLAVSF